VQQRNIPVEVRVELAREKQSLSLMPTRKPAGLTNLLLKATSQEALSEHHPSLLARDVHRDKK
jgi:hypothetical protein